MAALETLAKRHGLGEQPRQQLLGLLRALSSSSAPTAVHEPERALGVHIADSLVALDLDAVREARWIVDIGAGAGLPGLPLAIALPRAEVRMVESQRRKCGFIEMVCDAIGVKNATAVCVRAEEWSSGVDVHDLALARALAPQPVVLEYAAPLLRVGGLLVEWRGRRNVEEERASLKAASELGLTLVAIRRVEPYEGARDHHLHEYLKVSRTPGRFPRRAGVARKRPLGC